MENSQDLVVTELELGPEQLPGALALPQGARGVVLFAHGSGSSRRSRRNRFVAEQLHRRSLGTLLFDLLTDAEAQDRRNVFDIALLANRMIMAIDILRQSPQVATLPLGLFGASTGAAAALVAAALRPESVLTVVSRGGRPDLAGQYLSQVTQPVLLLVGGDDTEVLELNRAAARQLSGPHQLHVVPGATHLFEEPGTLEMVAELAGDWFVNCFSAVR